MKKLLFYLVALGAVTLLTAGSGKSVTKTGPVGLTMNTPSKPPDSIPVQLQNAASETISEPPAATKSWKTYRVAPNDTLYRIFTKFGLSEKTLAKILASTPYAKQLSSLRPGKEIEILTADNGILDKLRYRPNRIDTFDVSRTPSGYTTTKSSKALERRTAHATGLIRSSLYLDAKAAGLQDKLIMEMAKIFAWDIDFSLGIRNGDEFTVIYEKLFLDGQFYDVGSVLAVEFINRGRSHKAVRFTDKAGVAGYYTPEGRSLQNAFLRNPVKFARISSHFNLHRRHPVLNKIRAHKGVDYAAPTGTPVLATGDGTISFLGRKGGYGRAVIVQHGRKYSTLYAHLSRFSHFRTGQRVRQGETIGYVGASGLATGPHLHYEFRINGVHHNPLTIKLPHSKSIDDESHSDFNLVSARLMNQLELYRGTLLAQAEVIQAETQ